MEGLEAQVADLTAKLNEAEAPRKRLEKENSVRIATALPLPHLIFALLLLSVLPIFHNSKERMCYSLEGYFYPLKKSLNGVHSILIFFNLR